MLTLPKTFLVNNEDRDDLFLIKHEKFLIKKDQFILINIIDQLINHNLLLAKLMLLLWLPQFGVNEDSFHRRRNLRYTGYKHIH